MADANKSEKTKERIERRKQWWLSQQGKTDQGNDCTEGAAPKRLKTNASDSVKDQLKQKSPQTKGKQSHRKKRKLQSDEDVTGSETSKMPSIGPTSADQKPHKIKGRGAAPGGGWVVKPAKNKSDGVTGDTDGKTNPVSKSDAQSKNVDKTKNKYVLFLGNLDYSTTRANVLDHFKKAGNIKAVRLLTDKKTGRPRGIGYLELGDNKSHRNALQLHHSKLLGREINVEFTAPGRKSAQRVEHLKQKNLQLAKFKLPPDEDGRFSVSTGTFIK